MKEYDYAHQTNRPVPLEDKVLVTALVHNGRPTGALLLHRAIKKASNNNAPTRKN